MEPLICDGDRVLFEELPEGTPIRDGAIYVLSTGGSLKIKRLYRKINGDLIIRSENPKYADEIVPNTEIDSFRRTVITITPSASRLRAAFLCPLFDICQHEPKQLDKFLTRT